MAQILTSHFSVEQFTLSQTATRLGIDNLPPPPHITNLKMLAMQLEQVMQTLGQPLVLSSVYRCAELNTKVGGAKNSRHMLGLAADFICPNFGNPLHVAQVLASGRFNFTFDQIIHEYGRWVHLGISEIGIKPRMELLTIDKRGTRVGLLEVRQ